MRDWRFFRAFQYSDGSLDAGTIIIALVIIVFMLLFVFDR